MISTYCTSATCAKEKECPEHISKAPKGATIWQGDFSKDCLIYEEKKEDEQSTEFM